LSLPTNGVFCLAGPSGSGKTTLLRDILGDVFKRGGSKFSLVSPSSPVNQKTFSHFEYLDLLSTQNRLAVRSIDSIASVSGLDLLLAKHLSQTKEARLKGFLAKDFSLRQSRHKCKECLGRGVIFDGPSPANSDNNLLSDRHRCELCRGLRLSDEVLKTNWNGLEFGQLLAGSWTELESLSFGDSSIAKTVQNFIHFGFGSMSVGASCADLSHVDKIIAWFASSFSTRSVAFSEQPGAVFALDYPFVGLSFAEAENILAIMRKLTDLGHTIYCVDNNPAFSSLFDQTIRIESFLSGDGSRRSRIR
jgi:excinuclease ABC subunit A